MSYMTIHEKRAILRIAPGTERVPAKKKRKQPWISGNTAGLLAGGAAASLPLASMAQDVYGNYPILRERVRIAPILDDAALQQVTRPGDIYTGFDSPEPFFKEDRSFNPNSIARGGAWVTGSGLYHTGMANTGEKEPTVMGGGWGDLSDASKIPGKGGKQYKPEDFPYMNSGLSSSPVDRALAAAIAKDNPDKTFRQRYDDMTARAEHVQKYRAALHAGKIDPPKKPYDTFSETELALGPLLVTRSPQAAELLKMPGGDKALKQFIDTVGSTHAERPYSENRAIRAGISRLFLPRMGNADPEAVPVVAGTESGKINLPPYNPAGKDSCTSTDYCATPAANAHHHLGSRFGVSPDKALPADLAANPSYNAVGLYLPSGKWKRTREDVLKWLQAAKSRRIGAGLAAAAAAGLGTYGLTRLAHYLYYGSSDAAKAEAKKKKEQKDMSAQQPGQKAASMQQVAVQRYAPMGDNQRPFTPDEEQHIEEGESRWMPRIFQSYGTPVHEMMASPGKQALIAGLLGALGGAGSGAFWTGQVAGQQHAPLGAALGGAGLGGLMALLRYNQQAASNEGLRDIMRRLPPGATKRDYLADSVTQADLDRSNQLQSAALLAGNTISPKFASLRRMLEVTAAAPAANRCPTCGSDSCKCALVPKKDRGSKSNAFWCGACRRPRKVCGCAHEKKAAEPVAAASPFSWGKLNPTVDRDSMLEGQKLIDYHLQQLERSRTEPAVEQYLNKLHPELQANLRNWRASSYTGAEQMLRMAGGQVPYAQWGKQKQWRVHPDGRVQLALPKDPVYGNERKAADRYFDDYWPGIYDTASQYLTGAPKNYKPQWQESYTGPTGLQIHTYGPPPASPVPEAPAIPKLPTKPAATPGLPRLKTSSATTELQDLLALLHALYWNHQTTHWQVQGDDYYGNHLLFERLYEGLPGEYDGLAEKMVDQLGAEAVDQATIQALSKKLTDKWSKTEDAVERAIQAEKELQKVVKRVYDALKADDTITLGMDDFLMSLANDHETATYLLGQMQKSTKKAAVDPLPDARALEPDELDAVHKGESQWFPEAYVPGMPLTSTMASPWRQALLAGLAGGTAGSLAGGYTGSKWGGNSDNYTRHGAAIGGLGVGGVMALLAYLRRNAANRGIVDLMKRTDKRTMRRLQSASRDPKATQQALQDSQKATGLGDTLSMFKV